MASPRPSGTKSEPLDLDSDDALPPREARPVELTASTSSDLSLEPVAGSSHSTVPSGPPTGGTGRHTWLSLFQPVVSRFSSAMPSSTQIDVQDPIRVRYPTPSERLDLRSGRQINRPAPPPPRRRMTPYTRPAANALYRSLFDLQHRPWMALFLEQALNGSTDMPHPGDAPVEEIPRYSRKQSHPRKLVTGFRRDVAPPDHIDIDLSGEPSGPEAPQEALCASCHRSLLLEQPSLTDLSYQGLGRPWALCCGHLVCSACLKDARVRRYERKGVWRPLRGSGKRVHSRPKDDDADYDPTVQGPPKRAKGKGRHNKGQIVSEGPETRDNGGWIVCPVTICDGGGGDVAAEDETAAWEMFV